MLFSFLHYRTSAKSILNSSLYLHMWLIETIYLFLVFILSECWMLIMVSLKKIILPEFHIPFEVFTWYSYMNTQKSHSLIKSTTKPIFSHPESIYHLTLPIFLRGGSKPKSLKLTLLLSHLSFYLTSSVIPHLNYF